MSGVQVRIIVKFSNVSHLSIHSCLKEVKKVCVKKTVFAIEKKNESIRKHRICENIRKIMENV